MSIRSFFFLIFLITVLISCNSEVVYADISRIDGNAWHKNDVKEFRFVAPDSMSCYNMFLHIRNNSNYLYSNLFLITSISDPNGKVITDTLEYEMAKSNGEFLGKGIFIKDNKLWYKEGIKFVISENPYTVTVSHAMRKNDVVNGVEELQGITDVGIVVEKSKKH